MLEKKDERFLLIYDSVQFFKPYFVEKEIPVYPTLKKISFPSKIIRKLCFKMNFLKDYWFGKWQDKLHSIDTVIIFASNEPSPINYIRRKYPSIRIIFWYWNPVFKSISPEKIPDERVEKWSFDRGDCTNYSMKFNSTFYFDNISLPKTKIVRDIIFLGVDKGRRKALQNIKQKFELQLVDSYFYIVDDTSNSRFYTGNFPAISYSEYLTLIAESRAILDYVQPGQEGLTLRPMEALFFEKKLITNDLSIERENFYHPSNIFIIGKDDITKLDKFLNKRFCQINPEIRNNYDVLQWLSRF